MQFWTRELFSEVEHNVANGSYALTLEGYGRPSWGARRGTYTHNLPDRRGDPCFCILSKYGIVHVEDPSPQNAVGVQGSKHRCHNVIQYITSGKSTECLVHLPRVEEQHAEIACMV